MPRPGIGPGPDGSRTPGTFAFIPMQTPGSASKKLKLKSSVRLGLCLGVKSPSGGRSRRRHCAMLVLCAVSLFAFLLFRARSFSIIQYLSGSESTSDDWNTCIGSGWGSGSGSGSRQSILASRSAHGPYQPRPNKAFSPFVFPGLSFDACVNYNCWPFTLEEYEKAGDGVAARSFCPSGIVSADAEIDSLLDGAVVQADGYRVKKTSWDAFLTVSRIRPTAGASTRTVLALSPPPSPGASARESAARSRVVGCSGIIEPDLYAYAVKPGDTNTSIYCYSAYDGVLAGQTVLENVVFGRFEDGPPGFRYLRTYLLPSIESESDSDNANRTDSESASSSSLPPRLVWEYPAITMNKTVLPSWLQGGITTQPLPGHMWESAMIYNNFWHVYYNVIYRVFVAAHQAGWLNCPTAGTGASGIEMPCTIKHPFTVASDPLILKAEAIFEGGCELVTLHDLDGACVGKAIAGAPTSLDAHFTASPEEGRMIHAFAMFWANVMYPEVVPLLQYPPPRLKPRIVQLYRWTGSRGAFGDGSDYQFAKWAWEHGVEMETYQAEKFNNHKVLMALQSATIVLGSSGAAFTNTMFMRPGTVVILASAMKIGVWGESFYFRNIALSTGSCYIRWNLDKPTRLTKDNMAFDTCPKPVDDYSDPVLYNKRAFDEVLSVALRLGIHRDMDLDLSWSETEIPTSPSTRCSAHMMVDCPMGYT